MDLLSKPEQGADAEFLCDHIHAQIKPLEVTTRCSRSSSLGSGDGPAGPDLIGTGWERPVSARPPPLPLEAIQLAPERQLDQPGQGQPMGRSRQRDHRIAGLLQQLPRQIEGGPNFARRSLVRLD